MEVVRWLTPDVGEAIERFRARLAFQVEELEDGRAVIRLRNAVVRIESSGTASAASAVTLRAPSWERLEVGGGGNGAARTSDAADAEDDPDETNDEGPRPVHPNGAAELAAIGWTTVDHERFVRDQSALRYVFAGIDSLLGAGAWLSVGGVSPAAMLLEPSREGPVAAALARNGEAPAALYVRVRPRRWEALPRELRERGASLRGPVSTALGDAYLVHPDRPWGPFIVFVRVPSVGGVAGDHRPPRDAG